MAYSSVQAKLQGSQGPPLCGEIMHILLTEGTLSQCVTGITITVGETVMSVF